MSAAAMCSNCGEPASNRHGLPAGPDGEIVPIGYSGEWGAVPACKACHALHEAAGINGPAVLNAYFRVCEATLSKLEALRNALANIHDDTLKACRENEVDR